jgi:hypothetical protein
MSRRSGRANQIRWLLAALLLVGALSWLRHHSQGRHGPLNLQEPLPIPKGRHASYTTNFAVAENPISEAGKWIGGKAVGLDWSDVATVPGLAYGTESGTGTGNNTYDDSTALLEGTWGADQTVEATVHSVNQDDTVFEEVELRLRSSLSGHTATGYEVLFRCLKTPHAYASIVRWDGSLGKFTYLTQKQGVGYGVTDGDVVKATIFGDVIRVYVNDVQVLQVTDATYSSGNPGMGFWFKRGSGLIARFENSTGHNVDYGFTRFAAWD